VTRLFQAYSGMHRTMQ